MRTATELLRVTVTTPLRPPPCHGTDHVDVAVTVYVPPGRSVDGLV